MAKPGPPQLQKKVGRTPNADWVEVPAEPFKDSKRRTIPKTILGAPVRAEVRVWYDQLKVMPHCRLWAESDWLFLFDTAVLKQEFYANPTSAMATEIRRREDQMGTTAEARRKLGIRYVDPASLASTVVAAGNVSNISDRRGRLADAS